MATNDDIAVSWKHYSLPPGKFAATFDAPPEKIGSIFIAPVSKRSRDEATVVAVGPPYYDQNGVHRECFARVGDRILVDETYGRIYRYYEDVDGERVERKIHIFGFADVIAVVK